MNLTPTTRNVTRAYRAASADEVAQGVAWYMRAHDLAVELDPGNVTRAAAVIATLSPQASWSRNVASARLAYRLRPRSDVQVFVDGLPTTRVTAVKTHAILTARSDIDPLVHGPKVRAFWASIIDPESDEVVIDRHAVDVALGRVTDDRTRNLLLKRKGGFEAFALCYRRAAKILSTTPAQVQAVTWVYWRRNHAAHQAAHQRGAWD